MNKFGLSWRRWQGHFVIVGIALIILLLWRFALQPGIVAVAEGGGETAVSTPTPSESNTTPNTPPTFEDQELPVLNDNSLAPAPNPHTFEGTVPEHQFATHT
ncbi:MAG: hypothetical protein GY805_33275, partial [Chloroflexi bacterium]|nr:hypothetical protein [Chloroflexota bacterium]